MEGEEDPRKERGDLADKLMRLHLDLAAFILEKMSFFLLSLPLPYLPETQTDEVTAG